MFILIVLTVFTFIWGCFFLFSGVPLIAPKSKAIFYGYLGGFVNLSCAVIHEGNTTHFTWTRNVNNSLYQQSMTTFDDKFISTIQVGLYMICPYCSYCCYSFNWN